MPDQNPQYQHDVVVVGGGPTGLAAAAALARVGLAVALADGRHSASVPDLSAIASPAPKDDHRTAALFPGSLDFLGNLGVLDDLKGNSADLDAIRLVDMTGGLLRAPEVLFHAREMGLARLALNIPNSALCSALEPVVRQLGVVLLESGLVTAILETSDRCRVTFQDGTILETGIVIGADGRASMCRQAAGISDRFWRYDQAALVAAFDHSRPHQGVSTEIHGPAGPCTTVPLPGNRSSLVWVERPPVAQRMSELPPAEFAKALRERLGGLLGEIGQVGPRQQFPLSALVAETMARGRFALVGEAGHALPPIGAQGLNLGLADVAVLADVLADWKAQPDKPVTAALQEYASRRAGDIARRSTAVDLLNRSLETGSTALHLLRGAGLHLLAGRAGLRRLLMAQGLEPPHPLPALMRPPARPAPNA